MKLKLEERELYPYLNYEAPKAPEVNNERKVKVTKLTNVSERYHYLYNEENNPSSYYLEDLDKDELLPKSQSMSLKSILDFLSKNNLSIDDVFVTVSTSDDYINLELVKANKLTFAEEVTEYNLALEERKKIEETKEKARLAYIEQQMKKLEEEKNSLNKK